MATIENNKTTPPPPSTTTPNQPSGTEEIIITENLANLINEIAEREQFINFTVVPVAGSNLGDGFSSIMIRAIIKGQHKLTNTDKELRLLCKVQPTDKMRKMMSVQTFQRETFAYKNLLPKFCEFQCEKGIKGFNAFPKCYGTYENHETQEYLIVLEDLCCSNYKLLNKFIPIDFEHARLTMIELGRYHGLSFVLRDQQPELFQSYKSIENKMLKMMFDHPMMIQMINQTYGRALATVDKLIQPELWEKLSKFYENGLATLNECTSTELAEPYGVVNHGDCWNNNLMYQYQNTNDNMENGVPKKVCLIDWQLLQFGTPAIDLIYFFYTSTEKELRDKYFYSLLRVYHDSLSELVRELGSNPDELFTFDDLMRQIQKFGKYGLLVAPFLIQLLTARVEDLPNLDNLNLEDPKSMDFVTGKSENEFAKRMRDVIDDISDRGFF